MRIKSIELTPRDAVDIVIGAIEGGTGYWAECRGYRWRNWYKDGGESGLSPDMLRDIPRDEVLVEVREDAELADPERSPNSWFPITIEELERGVSLALARYPHLFSTLSGSGDDVELDLDAIGCDVITQLTVFGRVVYG